MDEPASVQIQSTTAAGSFPSRFAPLAVDSSPARCSASSGLTFMPEGPCLKDANADVPDVAGIDAPIVTLTSSCSSEKRCERRSHDVRLVVPPVLFPIAKQQNAGRIAYAAKECQTHVHNNADNSGRVAPATEGLRSIATAKAARLGSGRREHASVERVLDDAAGTWLSYPAPGACLPHSRPARSARETQRENGNDKAGSPSDGALPRTDRTRLLHETGSLCAPKIPRTETESS